MVIVMKIKRFVSAALALTMVMLATSPVFALDYDLQAPSSDPSEDVLMCYSDGEGRTLTNIDGDVYEVITATPENVLPVTDLSLLALLDAGSTFTGYTLFDIDNAVPAPWTGKVNLQKHTVQYVSPVIDRGLMRHTLVKFEETGHYWFNYCFHDFVDNKWYYFAVSDIKYSGAVFDWQENHGGFPGNSIDYCQFIFTSAYDNAILGNIGAAKDHAFTVNVWMSQAP